VSVVTQNVDIVWTDKSLTCTVQHFDVREIRHLRDIVDYVYIQATDVQTIVK